MNCISTRIAQVALFLATASLAFNASAAPAVKIDGVRQNFPWSNAVEINYSVTDCETGSANNYALRFVVAKGGDRTGPRFFVRVYAFEKKCRIPPGASGLKKSNALSVKV